MKTTDIRESLDPVAARYLSDGYETTVTYPAGATRLEPLLVAIDGRIGIWNLTPGEEAGLIAHGKPRGMRAWLLSRAEDLIDTLAEAGWYLESSPTLDFSSRVIRPVVSVSGSLFDPPMERGITLRVALSLRHLEPAASVPVSGRMGA